MGVPSLFAYFYKKYHKCSKLVKTINKENPQIDNHTDCLYLDFNGILHSCSHPQLSGEMFEAIMAYVDHIFDIIVPTKLLYIAIDGVAPRAKMNQQRGRRYLAAEESSKGREKKRALMTEMEIDGWVIPEEMKRIFLEASFDSSCITPGTEWMELAADYIKEQVALRVSDDPRWKDITVIVSDSTVVGEGEHKIMEFIRTQQSQPGYDVHMHHCIYGQDADLINLTLLTHESYFTILREASLLPTTQTFSTRNFNQNCYICGKPHPEQICPQNQTTPIHLLQPFILFDISTLRQYLYLEFCDLNPHTDLSGLNYTRNAFFNFDVQNQRIPQFKAYQRDCTPFTGLSPSSLSDPSFTFSFERLIDDLVLIMFLCGNDFLPRVSAFEINEGIIDRMLIVYKSMVVKTGYFTKAGIINFDAIRSFLSAFALIEGELFKGRKEKEKADRLLRKKQVGAIRSKRNRSQEEEKKERDEKKEENTNPINLFSPIPPPDPKTLTEDELVAICSREFIRRQLASKELKREDLLINGAPNESDEIKLEEEGYETRYYSVLFGDDLKNTKSEHITDKQGLELAVHEYIVGLQWVMLYYVQGCPSNSWFYPFHYAPLLVDLVKYFPESEPNQPPPAYSITTHTTFPFFVVFPQNEEVSPLIQLACVLSPRSFKFLPTPLRTILSDEAGHPSPLIPFYPSSFDVDYDGKMYEWQSIVKLPFISLSLLKQQLTQTAVRVIGRKDAQLDDLLTPDEKRRNQHTQPIVFFSRSHPFFAKHQSELSKDRVSFNHFITSEVQAQEQFVRRFDEEQKRGPRQAVERWTYTQSVSLDQFFDLKGTFTTPDSTTFDKSESVPLAFDHLSVIPHTAAPKAGFVFPEPNEQVQFIRFRPKMMGTEDSLFPPSPYTVFAHLYLSTLLTEYGALSNGPLLDLSLEDVVTANQKQSEILARMKENAQQEQIQKKMAKKSNWRQNRAERQQKKREDRQKRQQEKKQKRTERRIKEKERKLVRKLDEDNGTEDEASITTDQQLARRSSKFQTEPAEQKVEEETLDGPDSSTDSNLEESQHESEEKKGDEEEQIEEEAETPSESTADPHQKRSHDSKRSTKANPNQNGNTSESGCGGRSRDPASGRGQTQNWRGDSRA
ncbi:putative 5'-3' exoribonuclease 2 [Blattamonas nauphoetae]|uniref:5'-3' exoribonuclease 2 n=1 Tax=Blattamonas nauphoetae TaxID=2049346 RepID=A0ABQ9X2X0_9EUKA|nr:putative 5'-3' exoribonuclease 2 [Blattamonas nauphoetae]